MSGPAPWVLLLLHMAETIGFIGLGVMGIGMVKNLASKGQSVRILNRTAAKAEELAASIGVEYAASIPELAAESSVLMLCVTNSVDVEECLFGPEGGRRSSPRQSGG